MADYIYKPKAHQSDFLTLKNRVDTLDDSFAKFKYTIIPADTDLNTLTDPGMYGCTGASIAASLSNCPSSATFALLVMSKATSTPIQIIFEASRIYTRIKASSAWGNWYVHNGTAVS